VDVELIILDKCHLYFSVRKKAKEFASENEPTLEQFLHVCLDRAPDVDHIVNRLLFLLSSRMQNKSAEKESVGRGQA
jgi:hypothetical protein